MEAIENTIEKIKLGDKSLYKGVIEKYQRPIYIYCYQLLGHIQEAEDATQEVFTKVYEKLDLFDTATLSFSAWLYKIAYNYCITLIRRRKLLQFVPFADIQSRIQDSASDKVLEYELSEQLLEALKTQQPLSQDKKKKKICCYYSCSNIYTMHRFYSCYESVRII